MPGVAIGNFISSITQERLFPKVVDNVFEGTPILMRLRDKARPWSTGRRLLIPTTVTERSSLGSYSGFDTFTTTQEDVRQQFSIDPSEYYANVTISGIQKALNQGKEAVVDILAAEFSDVGRSLTEMIAEDLYLDGKSKKTSAVNKFVLIWEKLKSLIPDKHFLPVLYNEAI